MEPMPLPLPLLPTPPPSWQRAVPPSPPICWPPWEATACAVAAPPPPQHTSAATGCR